MAWMVRTDLIPVGANWKVTNEKLDQLLLQFPNWQDDVNGGGKTLSNVIISTSHPITVSGQPYIVSGSSGVDREFRIRTGGVERWRVVGDATPEGVGNVGTLFHIARHADNGAYIDSPVIINRQTGAIQLLHETTVRNRTNVVDAALAATGSDGGDGMLRVIANVSGNEDRKIMFGVDSTLGNGWIQAAHTGSTTYPILISPRGGGVILGCPASAIGDAQLHNNNLSIWIDEASNRIRFRVRFSTGVVKAGEVLVA